MRPLTRTRVVGRDRLERAPPRRGLRFDVALVWFMRAVALAWLAKGLLAWAQILGAPPFGPPFETRPVEQQAATIYFGVIDVTAAVGLWLASGWGGVIWLTAATSFLVLALLAPGLGVATEVALVATGALLFLYLALSWLAAREVH